MNKAVILLGGGIDSTSLLVEVALGKEADLCALFFNYGQKAYPGELASCKYFCKKYKVPLQVVKVELSKVANCSIMKGTSIGNKNENILEGRNAVFISIAVTYAATLGAKTIYTGFHQEPQDSQYEDAKGAFVIAFNDYVDTYLRKEFQGIRIECPFWEQTRESILLLGHYEDPEIITKSFTCYEGGKTECGACVHCKKKISMMKKLKIKV